MAMEVEEEPGTSGRGRDARNAPRQEQDLERFMQVSRASPCILLHFYASSKIVAQKMEKVCLICECTGVLMINYQQCKALTFRTPRQKLERVVFHREGRMVSFAASRGTLENADISCRRHILSNVIFNKEFSTKPSRTPSAYLGTMQIYCSYAVCPLGRISTLPTASLLKALPVSRNALKEMGMAADYYYYYTLFQSERARRVAASSQ